MKLPEQMQFRGSAESKGFRPVEQASSTAAMERETERHLQQQQLNLSRIHENETAVEKAKLNNLTGALGTLSTFSKTLSDHLETEQKKRNEAERQAGIMRAYEEGVPIADVAKYEADKATLTHIDHATSKTALELQKGGAPPEVVNQVKEYSAWNQWGYAQGKAQLAGEGYPLWIQEQLLNDDTTQITLPDGSVITPKQAAGDPAKQAAAIATLRQKYFQENMLVGMNPALLNEFTFPGMRKIEQTLLAKTRQASNINKSAEELAAMDEQLSSGTIDLPTFFTKGATTIDENGNPRGFSGMWNHFSTLVKDAADAGMPLDLEALGAQIDPETGKTYKERFKVKWALLEEEQRKQLRGNWDEFKAEEENQFSQAEQTAIDGISSAGNYTNAEIEAIQREFTKRYGRRSTKLDEMKNVTLEADQERQIEAQLKYKAEHGMLTPEDLVGLPLEIQQKWGQIAGQQGGEGSATAKPYLDSVKEMVRGATNWQPNTAENTMAVLATAELQTKWRQEYAKNLQTMPAAEAALRASESVKTYFEESQKNPSSKFYVGGEPGSGGLKDGKPAELFPNLLPKALAAGVEPRYKRFLDLTKKAQAEGNANGVFDIPGSVLNLAELKAIGDGTTGNIQVPAMVQYLSNKLNVSPWEIINRQRKAAGLKELGSTPAIKASEALTPRAQQLINQFPSPTRSARAWSTSGKFNEAIVPMGLGKEISKAAAAHGVDPAMVAAVIDWENRGKWSDKTSTSGARGIAQFMPATAKEFGVNVNDPVSSVHGAAKYLRYLLDFFNGDQRLAIIAYNAGPNAVRRFGGAIPGSKESQEYYPGVMRAYAKYSGTPSVAMRGRFQVRGQSGYVGSTNVVATGHQDQGNRPISFSPPAASAWQRMIKDGMPFSPGNVASSHRTEQDYMRIRAQGANPAANSLHNHGNAIDAHGPTGAWIRRHGHKYGWYANDYEGSHGGHYEFRG
jgi:hypothetical protein